MPLTGTFPRARIVERNLFITQDSVTYELHSPPTRAMMYDAGTGMPEIEYITQRGPFQHGESVKDYFLRPRVVELRYRKNCCSRQDYWDSRAELLNILRPNRGNVALPQGTLRKILPDGTKRDLEVTIQQGPRYEPQKITEWDSWSIDEILRFVAYNPVYYDPDQNTQVFGPLGALIFPITFPIVFADFGNTVVIDYQGNWVEYPSITITGPLTTTRIENLTTNELIDFGYTVLPGETVTFDLTYGVKSVTLGDGTNLIGYITPESDLATFHLQPGNNQVRILATGSSVDTDIVVGWFDRFVGI